MATKKEINNYYFQQFQKNIPSGTLTRWIREGKLKAIKNNNRYNYDFDDFINIVNSEEYLIKIRSTKEKPVDYIGKTKGKLLIKGIVPIEQKKSKYNGTLMYCDCLNCGKKNIQVRFTYLSDNGNYDQLTCGCGRKIRAFLASARTGITEDFLSNFDNFEKFLCVHKLLTHITDNYYDKNCNIDEYKDTLIWLYNDKQFNCVYKFWLSQTNKPNTFYDLSKPSIDHIIPLSKGGTSKKENLQVLTVFENLAKRDMTMNEWNNFKKNTHTTSTYFIEEVMPNE